MLSATLSSTSRTQQTWTLFRSLQRKSLLHYRRFFSDLQLTKPQRTWQPSRAFQRRFKHERSGAHEPHVDGDNPLLYDGKPSMFARWAWGLLALDMIFTASGVDLVMKHWTEVEETPVDELKKSETEQTERRYVLRPLWQRLMFSVGLVVGGVAAGGLILATRDRTVWRMRISRLKLAHQQANRTHLPRRPNAPVTEMHHSPPNYGPAILTLETASGRSKKHYLHDCELGPGRDATEMLLRVKKLRGAFVVRLPRSVILGEREENVVASPGSSVITVKGSAPLKLDLNDYVVKGSLEDEPFRHLLELQKRILNAWQASGGMLRASVSKTAPSLDSGWTSGPVASNR